jgi:hypothetical protein
MHFSDFIGEVMEKRFLQGGNQNDLFMEKPIFRINDLGEVLENFFLYYIICETLRQFLSLKIVQK